jgi:uncharacterized delta-60 repeat protein
MRDRRGLKTTGETIMNMNRISTVTLAATAVLLLACAADSGAPSQTASPAPQDAGTGATPDAAQPDQEPDDEPEPAFELAASVEKLPVLQGTRASVDISVTRSGFTGAIEVSVADLPNGVSAGALRIAAGEDHATLELDAAATAPHSLPTAVAIRGTAGELEDEAPLTVTVCGPPGSLDTSFAGGRVVMPVGASDDYAHAVAVQADGKIVVAGSNNENLDDIAVIRLERDGNLDASFGDAGVVTTAIGRGAETAHAVAVQHDGKIVVAGTTESETSGQDFALVRYTADGALDASFGEGGVVVTSFTDDSDTAYALVLQDDGKIVVGGGANQGSSSSGTDFALARYLEDGRLDESFGTAGKVVTSIAAYSAGDTVYALALQEIDGESRIVAAGGDGDFKLARYREDGTLDAAFGDAGKVVGLFGSVIGAARAVQVDAEGRIVVAGHSQDDFALARLDASGALDVGFGDAGRVVTPVSATNSDEARGLAIEEGGAIVVAGFVYEGNSTSGDFAIVRYSEDGALDPSFGDSGTVITAGSAPNRRDDVSALLLQRDERVPAVRVIVAGSASDSGSDFAVARYWR